MWLFLVVWGCAGTSSRDGSPSFATGGNAGAAMTHAGGSAGSAMASGGAGRGGQTPGSSTGGGLTVGAGGATGGTTVVGTGGQMVAGMGGTLGEGGGAPSAGGTATGGSAGTKAATYMIGADITWVQVDEAGGATYSDGSKKDILQLLKDHGFNYIRLRTFVDPKASDGYDKRNGYGDLAHTIAFGKRIKAAQLGFLLDFHYSDNWADPGKQCVPVAWQGFTTLDQLAAAVHDYTKNAIAELVAGGARPDVVQIGNEITPGMLLHVCDADGQPTGNNPISGSIANWANLGTLLKAGVQGVKDVDAGIRLMLHIDRGGDKGGYTGAALEASASFITNAKKQGVAFDYFGESCYQRYQGDTASIANSKDDFTRTFAGLATRFPDLRFVAAEYGPMQRELNDVVFGLAGAQGAGTFVWEPSRPGDWNTGHALFTADGNAFTATDDLSLYDAMKQAYGSRL